MKEGGKEGARRKMEEGGETRRMERKREKKERR